MTNQNKVAKIIIFQKHEVDVLYDKDADIEKIKEDLLLSGYQIQYHLVQEGKEHKNNIFFTKKLVIER